MASVKITFSNKIQANALAILAEQGELGLFINEYLDKIGASPIIADEYPYELTYDDDDFSPDHEVEYE